MIVNNVIVPHSGWDRNLDEEALRQPRDVYWSTVFRNASGILRYVSMVSALGVNYGWFSIGGTQLEFDIENEMVI